MVYALVATGFEESELIVPVDLLMRGGANVTLVGVSGKNVTGAHGITIETDCTLAEIDPTKMQMLFLPGGQPGVNNLWAEPEVQELVAETVKRGVPTAAICAAPMILGRLGLLEGKKAVCYPGCEGDLRGADVVDVPAVTDGLITTGKAAGAVFEFAAELLKQLGLNADNVLKAVYYA